MPLKISAKIGGETYSFLIDTGSTLSILPFDPKLTPFLRPTAVNLTNASGAPIVCHGEVDVELGIRCIRRSFPWSFVVADVVHPILGTDFLAAQSLIIDCKTKTLTDSTTQAQIALDTSDLPTSTYCLDHDHVDHRVRTILTEFPILTSPLQLSANFNNAPIKHHIDTSDTHPICFKARPLTGEKLKAAREEFQFLLNSGIIQRSNSPWASPLHLVPKKEPGSWRPCGDYRGLNSVTIDDKYPIPHLQTLTMSLYGNTVFSKLDLQCAYLQVPVHATTREPDRV